MLYVTMIFLKGKKKLPTKKLFISHASKDKPLIDRFVDLVLDTGCGLNRDEIFYTSDPDLGIKPGKDFIDYIKENLEDATLVILMISPNFYNSVFCLGELGATWALGIEIFPLIVPSLTFSDVGDLLKVTQMGMIGDKSYLDRLRDTVVRTHNIPTPKTATWNLKCDQFLRELPDILKNLPVPDHVKRDEHHELQETYQAALEEINRLQHEINDKKTLIEDLKKAKDRVEVQKILLENADEKDQFELLVNEVKSALGFLPYIVKRIFYYEFVGDQFIPQNNRWEGVNDFDQALEARQSGYLVEPSSFSARDDGEFDLNLSHRRVSNAQKAIDALSKFMRKADEGDFADWFYEENDYPIDQALRNLEFWQSYLF